MLIKDVEVVGGAKGRPASVGEVVKIVSKRYDGSFDLSYGIVVDGARKSDRRCVTVVARIKDYGTTQYYVDYTTIPENDPDCYITRIEHLAYLDIYEQVRNDIYAAIIAREAELERLRHVLRVATKKNQMPYRAYEQSRSVDDVRNVEK